MTEVKITREDLEKQLEEAKQNNEKLHKELEALNARAEEERKPRTEARQKLEGLKKIVEGLTGSKKLPGDVRSRWNSQLRDDLLYWPLMESIEGIEDNLDISGYIYRGSTPEEVIEYVEDYETEIINNASEEIYYSEAIRYLAENDPTLTESLELAEDYGYKPSQLNSCILATIHGAEFGGYREEFTKCIEAMKEKAEEINEAREKLLEESGAETIEDYVDQETYKRTGKSIAETWTAEELEEIWQLSHDIEEMEKKYQETTAEEIRKKHAEIMENNRERSKAEDLLKRFNQ